jgi:replicative superfamily II helicase
MQRKTCIVCGREYSVFEADPMSSQILCKACYERAKHHEPNATDSGLTKAIYHFVHTSSDNDFLRSALLSIQHVNQKLINDNARLRAKLARREIVDGDRLAMIAAKMDDLEGRLLVVAKNQEEAESFSREHLAPQKNREIKELRHHLGNWMRRENDLRRDNELLQNDLKITRRQLSDAMELAQKNAERNDQALEELNTARRALRWILENTTVEVLDQNGGRVSYGSSASRVFKDVPTHIKSEFAGVVQ